MLVCYYCFVIPINNTFLCCSNNRFAFNYLDFVMCTFILFRWESWWVPVTSADPVSSSFKERGLCFLNFFLKTLWHCVLCFLLKQKHVDNFGAHGNKMLEFSIFYKYTKSPNVGVIAIPSYPGRGVKPKPFSVINCVYTCSERKQTCLSIIIKIKVFGWVHTASDN